MNKISIQNIAGKKWKQVEKLQSYKFIKMLVGEVGCKGGAGWWVVMRVVSRTVMIVTMVRVVNKMLCLVRMVIWVDVVGCLVGYKVGCLGGCNM